MSGAFPVTVLTLQVRLVDQSAWDSLISAPSALGLQVCTVSFCVGAERPNLGTNSRLCGTLSSQLSFVFSKRDQVVASGLDVGNLWILL